MPQKILITGGSGLLAVNWAISVRDKFDVVLGLHNRIVALNGVQSLKINTHSTEDINRMLVYLQPDIVINTAGITSVEQCEKLPYIARLANTELAINFARSCREQSIKFVQISTDHLFSGTKAYVTEEELSCPRNVYGLTKGNAETAIQEVCSDSLIIRTNFYCWGTTYRKSFSDQIIETLRSGNHINLFTDVYYTPILAESLIQVTQELLELNAKGLYNVVGNDRITKFDFGVKLANCFGLETSLIRPSLMSSQKNLVQRPFDMSLSNLKVSRFLNEELKSLDRDLLILLKQEVTGSHREIRQL